MGALEIERRPESAPPRIEAGIRYSTVVIGSASQSRLALPALSRSYHRPNNSTAKLALQSFEITYDTDAIGKAASDETRDSRARLWKNDVRPKDQTVSAEVSAAIGTR
jgi:hypothetical protein